MANFRYNSFAEFNAKFGRAMRAVKGNIHKPLDSAASSHIFESVYGRFRRQVGPSGKPWTPLAPRTKRERAHIPGITPSRPILYRTGGLKGSIGK